MAAEPPTGADCTSKPTKYVLIAKSKQGLPSLVGHYQ